MNALYFLMVAAPVAILGDLLGWDPAVVFVLAAVALIPLAGLLGRATEELAAHTGPRLGGLLNATLGNAAELIITIFAIRAGLLELVKASITGSILGNILLVLGLAMFLGGLRNGVQSFDREHAGMNATMMILAVIALIVPSVFSHTIDLVDHHGVEALSIGVAIAMLVLYALSLVYAFVPGRAPAEAREHAPTHAPWSVRKSLLYLLLATVLVAWLSEVLVGVAEPVVEVWGISEFFLGIVIIPLVGNVAEHLVAVQAAWKNQMELGMAVAVGSSLQIALFVAPLLVFISLLFGNPLTLVFNEFELVTLAGAALVAGIVALDGRSNWLEGAQLLAVYVITALAFYFLP
ncbi:MAG: calcium/proton exchanger [Anaerolineae bacterium]